MIEEKWLDLALPKEQFDDLVRVGSFSGQVEWNRFFALAASALGEVNGFLDWKSVRILYHFFYQYFICILV